MVLVRGDDRETLQFYTRQGTDYTSDPLPGCWFSGPTGEFADPTLSPGAATVAWQENDGIWLSQVPASTDCERAAPRLEIPGASEPDFGPANVNPGPRPVVEPPRAPGPGPAPGPRGCCEPPADTTAPTLTLITRKTLKLRALLAGLKVSYRCSESCSTSASLRLDRRVAQRLRLPRTVAAGSSAAVTTGNVVLTPTRRAKRVLPRLPTVTMTLLVTARDGARNATSEQQRIVVRR
jgi:hypothetical protein